MTEQLEALQRRDAETRAYLAGLSQHGNRDEVEAELTDEEIDAAIAEGRGAQVFRRMTESAVAKLRKTEIEPMRRQSLESVAELAKASATAQMPHYQRFKREIDAAVAQLPAESRLNPAIYKGVHDVIVGQNIDKILAEEREKALRAARDPSDASQPGSTSGRSRGGGKIPTVEEVFGKDAADALEFKGKSADEFARSLGYQTWADYAKIAGGEGNA